MEETSAHESRLIHWARFYDFATGVAGRRILALHRRILERATVAPGEQVLDVGCGPGRLTLEAARAAGTSGEVLGIDASPEMITLASEKAARQGSNAAFRVASVEAIPAPDDHFDVALASLMLHHLSADLQKRAMAEVFRALRPGGRFVVFDFAGMPGHGIGHVLSVLGLRRGLEHAEHLRGLAAGAGFEPVEVERASRAFCIVLARKPASA